MSSICCTARAFAMISTAAIAITPLLMPDAAVAVTTRLEIKITSPTLREPGTKTWRVFNVKGSETADFSGELFSKSVSADGTVDTQTKPISVKVPKFDINQAGDVVGKNFKLEKITATTKYANVSAEATGQSAVAGKIGTVSVDATLSGELTLPNKPPKPVSGEYTGKLAVKDPFSIFASDVVAEGIDPQNVDLQFAFGIGAVSFSPLSEIALDVFMETTVGTSTLFSLFGDPFSGVSVSFDPTVSFYALADIGEEVDYDTATPLDMNAFANALISDIIDDGVLSAPVALAVYMPSIALPTSTLANGSVKQVGYGSGVGEFDQGVGLVPVPASGLLLATGFGVFGALVRRRRAARSSG